MTFKKKSILALIALLLLILLFPAKIKAEDYPRETQINFFYGSEDGSGDWRIQAESYDAVGDFSAEALAYIIFYNVFENPNAEKRPLIPENTRLLSARIIESELILSVSPEIKRYGGSAREAALTAQLFLNVRENPALAGVELLTLLIDGREGYLPEGTVICRSRVADGGSEISDAINCSL